MLVDVDGILGTLPRRCNEISSLYRRLDINQLANATVSFVS